MITAVANFYRKFKKAILAVVFLVVTHAAAGSAGYLIAERDMAREQARAEQVQATKKVEQIVKQAEEAKIKRVEVKVRDLARERQLSEDLISVSRERDNLQRILNEKPDPDSSVYLRVGDILMLNEAARPDILPSGISNSAGLLAYQEQASSTVTLRAFVSTELDIRAEYVALAKRHDALVDWVQVELIDSQLADKKALAPTSNSQ